MSEVTTRVIKTFDDPAVSADVWSQLLSEGDTNVGALTWEAQRLWWKYNERPNGLRLIVAERNGQPKAIAPLFVENGMAMNLCPVNWLDFVGDVSEREVIDGILQTIKRDLADFVGLRFYFVPHISRTSELIQQAANRLNLDYFLEDEQPSPIIDIRGKHAAALACTKKKTVCRRENLLRREGTLEIRHFYSSADIMPQLDEFFQQHMSRWADTPTPSRFCESMQRESFRVRTRVLAESGWLRFSRMDWGERPIAFHRGTCYQGHYKYGKTAFAPDLTRYSPGTVLLRHLLLAAIEEQAHTFDFGAGSEDYKYRYATDVIQLQTWGLYPVAR